jgi:predicted nucleic acid-binding protein
LTPLVVDASVAFKWYFEEPWSDAARRLLSGERLIVPRLFFLETSNVLRKRCERKEMSADDARATADSLAELPLEVWPDHRLVRPALDLALDFRVSMFDAVYVALAIRLQGQLMTADRRLVNALQGRPAASHVLWVEEIGSSWSGGGASL